MGLNHFGNRNYNLLHFYVPLLLNHLYLYWSKKDLGQGQFSVWYKYFGTVPKMTQSFTEEKKGLDFSPRSGEATSGEK